MNDELGNLYEVLNGLRNDLNRLVSLLEVKNSLESDPLLRDMEEVANIYRNRVKGLKDRLDRLMMSNRNNTVVSSTLRQRALSGDPPCSICGSWSDSHICPKCRARYGWLLDE